MLCGVVTAAINPYNIAEALDNVSSSHLHLSQIGCCSVVAATGDGTTRQCTMAGRLLSLFEIHLYSFMVVSQRDQ
jgi:hypothetical protein